MKILVDRLTTTPTEFASEGDAAWWRRGLPAGPGHPPALVRPFAFHCAAHLAGEDVYLEGAVSGEVELECSRCLARYGHVLREPFRLVLEPVGTRAPSEPAAAEALRRDGVCLGDEIEAGWFRGDEIDLGEFFREVISLALPVKPLCKEDCAGLCPQCGAELNETRCGCRATPAESPFAVLAALRDGSIRGEK
jgi:uncharacterized protein